MPSSDTAILVTGAAGFIGAALSRSLLERGEAVIGIDNFNDYYDPALKHARVATLSGFGDRFTMIEADFGDTAALETALTGHRFDRIVHLGAQAGVRYSLVNPHAYVHSNLAGHLNLLELARHRTVRHMVYASSSSVYGGNDSFPFRVEDRVDHPVSLYAATKKSNELMSESYAHLYRIPLTGLRFFTVYGPWGRPDMAAWIFTRKILAGEPIPVFNRGEMRRDFTYIDDIVEGVLRTADKPPAANPNWNTEAPDPATSSAPYRVYNIGNNNPVELMDFIAAIEKATGREAKKVFLPRQPGDVPKTFANVDDIARDVGFRPSTPITEGVARFVDWYRSYYK
jgi:UDP-glucuronate 4-epimerase